MSLRRSESTLMPFGSLTTTATSPALAVAPTDTSRPNAWVSALLASAASLRDRFARRNLRCLLRHLPDAAQGDVPIPIAACVDRAELPVIPVGRVQGFVAVFLGRRREPFCRQARNRVTNPVFLQHDKIAVVIREALLAIQFSWITRRHAPGD